MNPNGSCSICHELRPCSCGFFCPSCKDDIEWNEDRTLAKCIGCGKELRLRAQTVPVVDAKSSAEIRAALANHCSPEERERRITEAKQYINKVDNMSAKTDFYPEPWENLKGAEGALLQLAYQFRRGEFGNLSLEEVLGRQIQRLEETGDMNESEATQWRKDEDDD